MIDISKERESFLYASIMYAITPILLPIALPIALYFTYISVKGLKEKSNITKPYKYFLNFLTSIILIFMIFIAAVFIFTKSSYTQSSTGTTYTYSLLDGVFHGSFTGLNNQAKTTLTFISIIILILWIIAVLFFGRMLSTLSIIFKNNNFDKASEIWFIANYGFILFLPLLPTGIMGIVYLSLEVSFAYYLIHGALDLPYNISTD